MPKFSEDSRVKFPTIMHLMSMGYKYVSLKGLKTNRINVQKTNYDPSTNNLTDIFSDAYFSVASQRLVFKVSVFLDTTK